MLAGACWVSVDQVSRIPLRDPTLPLKWFAPIAAGTAELLPLEIPEHASAVFEGLTF